MFTNDLTTSVLKSSNRWIPGFNDQSDIEAALNEANVSYDDLYPSPRRGRWQIEAAGGNAKAIARKLNNTAGFWEADGLSDELDGESLALVTFSYECPTEFDPYFETDWFED